MEQLQAFRDLGISEEILKGLQKKGFEEPSPIQKEAIPILLKDTNDFIGQAQTGTGKTAAFGVPLIEKIDVKSKSVQALILTPTRELAIQVSEEIHSLSNVKGFKILPIYGGQSIGIQISNLKKGFMQVIVGTPGRIIDHIKRGTLNLSALKYVVLDEADEMLNMGFIEDIEKILQSMPDNRRTWLFSATMPPEIRRIAKKYMKETETVKIEKSSLTADLTDQIYFEVSYNDKFEALCRIIDIEDDFYAIVFCRTKNDVDTISMHMKERGYNAAAIHGDITQQQREKVLGQFKSKKLNILVATDVAARGIDVNDLTHVINYSIPQDPESYVHRIGRTGRAGKEGTAITFVTPDEYRRLIYIKNVAKTDIRKEKIPDISDVLEIKKDKLKDDIFEILESKKVLDYMEFANELTLEYNPVEVLAAVLKYGFSDVLDRESYRKIKSVNVNRSGTTRLFLAKGKMDQMTPRKIVDMIQENVKIQSKDIKEIRIFDKFSFLNVPFEQAEAILEHFKRNKKGRKPLVERAKEKK